MRKIMLNGQWELAEAGNDRLCEVQVPGSVLSGLYGAGKIEDPFYRTNEDVTRELFRKDYEFSRTFVAAEDILKEEKIILVCEGLDTLADIYINGQKAGSADNMHRTWKLDVKEFLHSGENQIRIVFRSVFKYIEAYEYEDNKEIHYVPCGGMKGNQLIRKAHCMFGWDWGPQTIDAGIFRDIYLEAYSHPRIEDVKITQVHGDNAVDVCTTVAVSGDAVDKCQVRVTIQEDAESVCGHRTGANDRKTEAHVCKVGETVSANNNPAVLTSSIHNPKLWWPNGYGDQPLYKVQVELLDEYGTVLETITKRIGLRTLTISQEKDLWGKEFAFCVNGVKIFAMGGNYIPEDCIYSRITPEVQKYILESCKRANFNCVRVWGGGYYPSDHFYDLCDEMGLIVWQDLMFACNVYDLTEEFEDKYAEELKGWHYELISENVCKHLSDTKTPQGVIAVVRRTEPSIEELLHKEKNPCFFLLENLQDPGNLGTIVRTAEGAGVTGIIMNRETVDIYNPKVIRSTMGAIFRVPFVIADSLPEVIFQLKQNGVSVYAGHLKGDVFYKQDYRDGSAFLIGNEGNGLTDEITALADHKIKIPMKGKVESLNAAVSATILMYETMRQREFM